MAIAKYKASFSEYHQGSTRYIHILSAPISETKDPVISQDDVEKIRLARDKSSKRLPSKLVFHGSNQSDKAKELKQMAKRLKRSVCLIDCQMLQNKYIGETEKNLSKLVAQAESENWILFFDEADALFGKRSKVEPNHNKFANQQVSYLFRRLSEYKGMSILSLTDDSVLDRIKYAIDSVINFR